MLLLPIIMVGQQTIDTSGQNATGTGGSVSYSVGQIVYTTNSGTNGSVAQGVQQPYEISVVLGIHAADAITILATLFPNPTTDVITIKQANVESITIYNLQGQHEYELKNSNHTPIVDIGIKELTAGIHFIQIKTNNNIFYSKFIKLN